MKMKLLDLNLKSITQARQDFYQVDLLAPSFLEELSDYIDSSRNQVSILEIEDTTPIPAGQLGFNINKKSMFQKKKLDEKSMFDS